MVFAAFRSDKPEIRSHTASRRSYSRSATIDYPWTRNVEAIDDQSHPRLTDLNDALLVLAEIFPNVRPEVFREMLGTFSPESRLQVITEQLLRHQQKWVKGRWRIAAQGTKSEILKEVFDVERGHDDVAVDKDLVPLTETFRSDSYKKAVVGTLAQEFRSLRKSTIAGVLAEQNYSYTSSRPILAEVAAKSWRLSLSSLLSRWRKSGQAAAQENHYMIIWSKPTTENPAGVPQLRPTGSEELDCELRESVLRPLLRQRFETQDLISSELATLLNEQEAEAAGATYECECCFSDVTFESMATCSTGEHTLCFRCIQNGVSEALFGQSWPLNIDHTRSQLACLAPSSSPCTGCIPHQLTKRAVLQTRGGEQTWQKLEQRLASDAMQASAGKFVQCPFCSYAEVDDVYYPPRVINFRLNLAHPIRLLFLVDLAFCLLPILVAYSIFSTYLGFPRLWPLVLHAFHYLTRKTHLSQRLTCRNPACARPSCRLCKGAWRDPHVCHESATLSLRTTVEAARTAALKRTCPNCGLAFVKESGCNKMVCVCGYSMCYVCRQGLGRKPSTGVAAAGPGAGAGEVAARPRANLLGLGALLGGDDQGPGGQEEGEGYRHFCQHFRPMGGRCTECDKCDLYRGEDEDEIVRRAGERAEREWRRKQGADARGVRLGGEGRDETESAAEGITGVLQGFICWWFCLVFRC